MKSEKGFIHLLIVCEIILLILVLIFSAVRQLGKKDEPADYEIGSQQVETETEETGQTETEAAVETETEMNANEPIVFSEEVNAVLAEMSLEQKVAQLFLVSPETLTNTQQVTIAGRGTRTALTNYPVGGILYARNNYQGRTQMTNLVEGAQEISQEVSGQYLFVATLVETEVGNMIAFSNNHSAGPIIDIVASGGDVNEAEEGTVMLVPEATQMESTNVDTDALYCVSAQNAESAVQALQNGAELLCVTEDFESIYSAVLEAVNEGMIDTERIEQAVGKILTVKLAMIA